jgi:DNA-binding beta-propeller fold protein YncE
VFRLCVLSSCPLSNNRVLFFSKDASVASRVYGQFDATGNGRYYSGANRLSQPRGVALDPLTGGLWVCDQENHRIVFFPPASTTAIRVIGQADLTVNYLIANRGGANPSALSLKNPYDIAVDYAGGLFVADSDNCRALYYPPSETNKPVDATASRVWGQAGSFTTPTVNKGGISANSLWKAFGVGLDNGGNLFIVDSSNNRVMGYFAP